MKKKVLLKMFVASVVVACNSGLLGAASPVKKMKFQSWFNNTYFSRGERYSVTFKDPEPGKFPDAFPEPPMVIADLKTKAKCNCDGGIWERDEVYLSGDERLLIVRSYTGSNRYFEFYDTSTCRKLSESDESKISFTHTFEFNSEVPKELIPYVGGKN